MAEIPVYTFDELQELNLPGYKKPGDIHDVLSPESDWESILSVSVFKVNVYTLAKKSLTALRISNTHDEVISTPTMQTIQAVRSRSVEQDRKWLGVLTDMRQGNAIPQEPCELSETAPTTREFGTVVRYDAEPYWLSNEDTLSHYVDTLNTYKLGLPSVVEARSMGLEIGSASLASVHIGFSCVGENTKGEPLYEPLSVLAAAEMLTPEAIALLPDENDKYKYIGWTEDSSTFVEDVNNKDTLKLAPRVGNAALYYCAYGHCLNATSAVVSRDDLDELFMHEAVKARLNQAALEEGMRLRVAHRNAKIKYLLAREGVRPDYAAIKSLRVRRSRHA